MNIKLTLLAAACVLALSACGDKSAQTPSSTATPPADTTAPAATTTPAPASDAASAGNAAPTGDAATATTESKAPPKGSKVAVVSNCATEIEGNDAMQFNVNSITVPASCTDFTITLKHVGKMPVAAMGHNVVITTADDMAKVTAEGMAAGLPAGYIKEGGEGVIAHTDMIGGGQTTSVTFPVSKIQGGSYKFFCSFPGHAALMNGTINVG